MKEHHCVPPPIPAADMIRIVTASRVSIHATKFSFPHDALHVSTLLPHSSLTICVANCNQHQIQYFLGAPFDLAVTSPEDDDAGDDGVIVVQSTSSKWFMIFVFLSASENCERYAIDKMKWRVSQRAHTHTFPHMCLLQVDIKRNDTIHHLVQVHFSWFNVAAYEILMASSARSTSSATQWRTLWRA